MNIIKRVQAPTPKFFRLLRSIGLSLLGLSASVAAAPVVLPATIVSIAGYVAVAGSVISAISQITIADLPERTNQKSNIKTNKKERNGS